MLIERYTAAIIQFMRVNPEEIPDVHKRREANLKKALETFKTLETWDQIIPVRLTVLPENILRHEFDTQDPNQTQADRVATAVATPGPETDQLARARRGGDGAWEPSVHGLLRPVLPGGGPTAGVQRGGGHHQAYDIPAVSPAVHVRPL